jgi:hypothetical protein
VKEYKYTICSAISLVFSETETSKTQPLLFGGQRKLRNEEFRDLFSTDSMIKTKRMRKPCSTHPRQDNFGRNQRKRNQEDMVVRRRRARLMGFRKGTSGGSCGYGNGGSGSVKFSGLLEWLSIHTILKEEAALVLKQLRLCNA